MNWAGAVFGVSAAIALLGALGAVGLRSIFHNILSFAVAMLGVAGVFLSLGSDFLAVVFVLVYVGAVAIAMVYAVMLSYPLDLPPRPRSRWKVVGAAGFAGVGAGAIWLVLRSALWISPGGRPEVTAAHIGARFLQDYVLAFELVSVLLVVAMMGAVVVARRSRSHGGR
jgi:NADH:ubiquinone oxidoreductase subunit 6 (subunit J)